MTGMKFGDWTVLEENGKNKWNEWMWLCRCSCDREFTTLGRDLRTGKSTRCRKCSATGINNSKWADITGKYYGKLIVLGYNSNTSKWECRCGCSRIIHTRAGDLNSGNTQSCNSCIRKGENSPRWNSNLTNEDRQDRRLIQGYNDWVQEVFEKDRHTCQHCGDNKGGNLTAHHLEGYDNFPELRTALENGTTLCENCHKDFHHQYGYGGNTEKQFKEFTYER